VPQRRVDEVLEVVGLRDRAQQRVKSYSLGMRQRLAVASALLKSPELLILDEPANGLDPAGIREMRDLVRDLAATGTTVLVSSHILAEIEQICDSVTIISRGRGWPRAPWRTCWHPGQGRISGTRRRARAGDRVAHRRGTVGPCGR
jgi:ABC-2 type transport system ATP-binding protein